MSVNFKEKWKKLSWLRRAEIEEARGNAYRCIAYIDQSYADLEKLRKAHKSTEKTKEAVRHWLAKLEEAENELQHLWGLKQDTNGHTYWLCPEACTCPKLDNMDYLDLGKIISADCPLHGKKGLVK